MTETGSLEPGGEVPPRQGKCSERRGRDDKQSRAEKHKRERTRGGGPACRQSTCFFYLFLETLLLWNVDGFVHGHILANRAEVMLTSLRLFPRN